MTGLYRNPPSLLVKSPTHRLAASAKLISRAVFAEVPPRVDYEITSKARGLGPAMEALTARHPAKENHDVPSTDPHHYRL